VFVAAEGADGTKDAKGVARKTTPRAKKIERIDLIFSPPFNWLIN
jgi:hypothetical protein